MRALRGLICQRRCGAALGAIGASSSISNQSLSGAQFPRVPEAIVHVSVFALQPSVRPRSPPELGRPLLPPACFIRNSSGVLASSDVVKRRVRCARPPDHTSAHAVRARPHLTAIAIARPTPRSRRRLLFHAHRRGGGRGSRQRRLPGSRFSKPGHRLINPRYS